MQVYQGFGADPDLVRSRNGRAIVGNAAVRPAGVGGGDNFVSFPFYGPWGSWYPWYGGLWDYGFITYNPWRYGATRWYWSPYGFWYDPYSYYWPPEYMNPSYGARRSEPREEKTSGSLRIKANLDVAKIYVDGALVGTVADFDGLKNHLELEGGRHTLEFRADGYKTVTQEVEVKVGKTQTLRVNLKR